MFFLTTPASSQNFCELTWKGCIQLASTRERRSCTNDSLSDDIFQNHSYPKYADYRLAQGKVQIEFQLDSIGKTTDQIVRKSDHTYLDSTALSIVESFPPFEVPMYSDSSKCINSYVVTIRFTIH